MAKRSKYDVEMYYGNALVERFTIITEKYPLVYKIASLYFDNDVHVSKCYVLWEDVVLAALEDDSRLDSVQQIPQSL